MKSGIRMAPEADRHGEGLYSQVRRVRRECKRRYRERLRREQSTPIYAPDGTLMAYWFPTSDSHGVVKLLPLEERS